LNLNWASQAASLNPMSPGRILMRIDRHVIGAVIFGIVLLVACVTTRAEKHPPAKPIDLNLANAKELQELPGVGPVTAQRIVGMREKSGRFKRVEDLLAIRGISQKKLDAMRPYITVSATPPPAPPAQKSAPPAKKPSP
jgi:competence ComEA-like helix-hairpin-helix protein